MVSAGTWPTTKALLDM
jgi:hypothetical protein